MKKLLILSSLLSFSLSAHAYSLDQQGHAQLHGYLQRIAQSQVDNPNLKQHATLIGDYTEAGLNLNWQARPTTRLIADLHYHSKSPQSQNLNINILSLNQTLYTANWGGITLGLGRLKNTLIGLNSAQDAPLLRETTRFSRLYIGSLVQVVNSIDGARLQAEWSDNAGNLLTGTLFTGGITQSEGAQIQLHTHLSLEVNKSSLTGIKVTWEPAQLPGLLLGANYIQLDTKNTVSAQVFVTGLGIRNITMPYNTPIDIQVLMARYQWQQWQVSGEWMQPHIDKAIPTGSSSQKPTWYLSLLWQPTSQWSTTLRYEVNHYGTQNSESTGWIGYARYRFHKHYFIGVELDQFFDSLQHKQETVALGQFEMHF